MANPNFKKKDVIIIVLFFVFYGIGYAWLIEPKDKTGKKIEKVSTIPKSESRQPEMRQPKSLSINWPDTCEQYEREFDVEGSDMILQFHFEQVAEKFCSNTFVVSPVPFNIIVDIDG